MDPIPFTKQFRLVFARTASDAARNFPLAFIAPTLLAAFVAIIFASAFDAIGSTPGFPTDTFIEWVAPGSVLLTAFVGAGYAASALLRDIETGYLDRLRLLPIRPSAIITARAAFEGIRVIPPAAIVLATSLLLGAENRNGITGFLAVIAITTVLAISWNGVFFAVAIRSRNQQAVLGLQSLFMPLIMFSTFFAPTANAPAWFDTIATFNPFTQVLDGTRSVLFANTDSTSLLIGIAAFVALGALTYSYASGAFATLTRAD